MRERLKSQSSGPKLSRSAWQGGRQIQELDVENCSDAIFLSEPALHEENSLAVSHYTTTQ